MHLIFFKQGEQLRDPVTGENLGADTDELGDGRIWKVLDKITHTELFDDDALPMLKPGIGLVTK